MNAAEAGSTIPFSNMGTSNHQEMLSELGTAKVNENMEQVIPQLLHSLTAVTAQLAALQGSFAQLQAQSQLQQQPLPEQPPQQEAQQPPTGTKHRNSVALPIVPQALLNSRRKTIEEEEEDGPRQQLQDEQGQVAVTETAVAIPLPPPMIDLTPVETTLIIPKKTECDVDNPDQQEAQDEGTSKNKNSPAYMGQLNEKIKAGIALKKTPEKEPKRDKAEDTEEKFSFQYKLRSTKTTTKEGESVTSNKDIPEKANPTLELIQGVQLRKTKMVTTEPKQEKVEVEVDGKDDVATCSSPMENKENQESPETFDFKARLKPPSPNRKPSLRPKPTTGANEVAVGEEISVKMNLRSVKRTTSLPEKSTVEEKDQNLMVAHIKNMMRRRTSQIYSKTEVLSTTTLSTPVPKASTSTSTSSTLREYPENGMVKQETDSKIDCNNLNQGNNLSEGLEFKDETCPTTTSSKDEVIPEVDLSNLKPKVDPPESPKQIDAVLNTNGIYVEDEPSSSSPLAPTASNQTKVESIISGPKNENASIPLPPPPPPPMLTPATSSTSKMSLKYTNEETTVRNGETTTKRTKSFLNYKSSSSGDGEPPSKSDLLKEIQSFPKEKKLARASERKQKNRPIRSNSCVDLTSLMTSLASRAKAMHGDSDSDTDEDSKSMDEEDWDE